MTTKGSVQLNILLMIVAGLVLLGIGGATGYYAGGGKVKAMTQEEISKVESEDMYQTLPKDASLDEALAGGHYSHCVIYPGVGLMFSGKDEAGNLVIGQSPLTYPARKAELLPGYKVVTPLDVIVGDLNSPVKIQYKGEGLNLTNKEVILNRVMVKKCYRKEALGKEMESKDGARSSMEQ